MSVQRLINQFYKKFESKEELEEWLKSRGVDEVKAGEAAVKLFAEEFDRPSTLLGISSADLRDIGGFRIPFAQHLSNKLSQEQQKKRSIFSHGLPEMGPISQYNHFTSNPSVPTDEQHAPATIKVAPFSVLSDLQEPGFPADNIWNRITEEGHLGGFANESGVNKFVERVMMDVIDSIGVKGEITIREEVEVMRNRPDFMLILVDGHPIGMIEGKQPGKDAMSHPNILGEVYDQLMHLRSIFRVDAPFAILTCYNQWRICWLNESCSIERAVMETIPMPVPFSTLLKQKQPSETEAMDLGDESDSPPPPQTPSRKKSAGCLQQVDGAGLDVPNEDSGTGDYKPRTFFGTEIMEWNDLVLPRALASLIKKMMLAQQEGVPPVLRLANETTSAWKAAPPQDSLNYNLCISRRVKKFFLWEDLGHGADGKAFLVSGGTKGAVGVLKFFFSEAATKAPHEESMWKKSYGHLHPVASIRTVTIMGQTALLMPWFQCHELTEMTLKAVEKTLREDFLSRGLPHDDVAWRNVGVYYEDGQTKAVVFDMQKVVEVENQDDSWVRSAIASLSQKLM